MKDIKSLLNDYCYLIIGLLPLIILFRSASLNLYIFFICIMFIFFFSEKRIFKNYINYLWIYIFVIFWIYIVINSYLTENNFRSLQSAISQIRFLILALAIGFFFQFNIKALNKLILTIGLIIFFVSIDTIYQYFFGHDIFGIEPSYDTNPYRLSGPFGKELIVGGYISFLSAPVISYCFLNLNKSFNLKNFYFIIFILTTFFAVLLSGERMSLLFYCCNIFCLLFFIDKKKITLISSLLIITLFSMYTLNQNVKSRINNFIFDLKNFENSNHARLFSSAYNIWKDSKIRGVGLKNYRIICDESQIDKLTDKQTLCSTHPHNIYLEFLSETGLIGLILFSIFILNFLIFIKKHFKKLGNIRKSIFIGSLSVVLFYIWPVKSNGSFFSTFSATLFWFNIGLILLTINTKNKKID